MLSIQMPFQVVEYSVHVPPLYQTMNFLALASKMTHISPHLQVLQALKQEKLLTLQAAYVAKLLPQTTDNSPN